MSKKENTKVKDPKKDKEKDVTWKAPKQYGRSLYRFIAVRKLFDIVHNVSKYTLDKHKILFILLR